MAKGISTIALVVGQDFEVMERKVFPSRRQAKKYLVEKYNSDKDNVLFTSAMDECTGRQI